MYVMNQVVRQLDSLSSLKAGEELGGGKVQSSMDHFVVGGR